MGRVLIITYKMEKWKKKFVCVKVLLSGFGMLSCMVCLFHEKLIKGVPVNVESCDQFIEIQCSPVL